MLMCHVSSYINDEPVLPVVLVKVGLPFKKPPFATLLSNICTQDEPVVCVRAGRMAQGAPWWALHLHPRAGGQRPAEVPWSQGTSGWGRGEHEVQRAEVLRRRGPPPGRQAGGRLGWSRLCANGYVPPANHVGTSERSLIIFFFRSLKSLQEKQAAGQRQRILQWVSSP